MNFNINCKLLENFEKTVYIYFRLWYNKMHIAVSREDEPWRY